MVTGLAGRVVCITGAAERAGAEFARRYVQAGAKVMISHLPGQAAQAEALLAELGPATAACAGDITDPAQGRELVAACCDHFGRLDVLVHNASTFAPRPWLEVDEAAFDSALGVNLRGPFFLSQARREGDADPGRRATSWPWSATRSARPGRSSSRTSVAKTALARLMEQLAIALAPTIACNVVAPQPVLPLRRRVQRPAAPGPR